jgi:hypothetical protein
MVAGDGRIYSRSWENHRRDEQDRTLPASVLAVLAVFISGCFVAGHALKFISDLRSENSKKHLRVIQLEVELVRLGHEVPPRPAAR